LNRWKIVGLLSRVHLAFFFAGAGFIAFLTYRLLSQPGEPLTASQVVVGTALISVVSVLLHIGAFDLTVDMVRMGSAAIEKNPFSRFLFRRLGYNRTLWASSVLMAALIGWSLTTDPTTSQLEATAAVFIGLNLLDYANDRLATGLVGALFSSPSAGVPVQPFLPCPILRPYELTEERIRRAWAA
jgi:hypothetical protein